MTINNLDLLQRYENEIKDFPVLTKIEEQELGKLIQQGLKAQNKIKTFAKSTKEYKELKKVIIEGEEARSKFIQSNLKLVVYFAKRQYLNSEYLMDLIFEGNRSLIKHVDNFDYTKGFKFSTYAGRGISQDLDRAFVKYNNLINLPYNTAKQQRTVNNAINSYIVKHNVEPSISEISEITKIEKEEIIFLLTLPNILSLNKEIGDLEDSSLEDLIKSYNVLNPSEEHEITMVSEKLNQLLKELTDIEQTVILLRYGLIDGKEYTLKEVGDKLDLSAERIRQIQNQAIKKLKKSVG